jgi:hypothetical protein
MAFVSRLSAISTMGRLEALIGELAQMTRAVSRIAAPRLTMLIQRQFAAGTDPYGRQWRRLADGRRSHLTRTGRLRRGTAVRQMQGGRAGLRLVLGAPYGYFHQVGTVHHPARRIFPQRGMPAAWRAVLEDAVRRAARDARRRSLR